MQKFKLLPVLFLIALPLGVWGQLNTYPLQRSTGGQIDKSKNQSSKVRASGPLSLPFWDDFSFAVSGTHPVDSLWIKSDSVLVSSGQGINAPTINVATFDGLDDTGTPYNPSPTDILVFGYTDTLESRSIKMTEVAPADRDGVYLSFKYQAGGNGEPPDPQDFLRLEFKKSDGEWQSIVTLRPIDAPELTIFYDKLIQITDNIFYHDEFRFRFVSFGRRSGQFDAWHIDYVYLNKGGEIAKNTFFPDRAYYTNLSPLFNEYYAMPQSHFKTDAAGNIGFPFFGYNSLEDKGNSGNYVIHTEIISWEDSVMTQSVQSLDPTPLSVEDFQRKLVTLEVKPDLSSFISSDSIFLKLTMVIETGDGEVVGVEDYAPIDFNINDTLRQSFTLKDYYAYDDGEAEYSAGLVDSRNELAYRFEMKTNTADTINGLYVNFPPFTGGTPASNVEFFILDEVEGRPGNILYEELIPVTQNSDNEFTPASFAEGVLVQGAFYVGYREPTSGKVRIGLDKSNDAGAQVYYRLSETSQWLLNDRVTGSLMIRPRFGPGKVTTSVPEAINPVSIYPNPSNGEFIVKGAFDQFRIISTTGQQINTTIENDGDNKRVRIVTAPGIYIIQYKSGAKIYTEKILITK